MPLPQDWGKHDIFIWEIGFFSPVDQEGDGRLELGLGRFDGAARECKAQ